MDYDIIFITGEVFFDHPLCGIAILKRLLEKEGYNVGIVETPRGEEDIAKLGKPKLFFAISSGGIDSMVKNYTPLKKKREEDEHVKFLDYTPDRAVLVYSNWVKKRFKDSIIVIGGTEATLRRFTHYDYWDNKLRRSILLESRANILVFGSAEKQLVEIAARISKGDGLEGIKGTCITSRSIPEGFIEMPNHEDVTGSKDKFCDMQNMLDNYKDLAQKTDKSYVLQYQSPEYTSKDLDGYYELPFTRDVPEHVRGFQFSVVTHRGCIGNCSFCTLCLTQGDRIISRSEESILREIKSITKHPRFRGNIDDLGGPSANMYGLDCINCGNECLSCPRLDRTNKKLLSLLKKAREIEGVKKVYVRSGIRYDLVSPEYLKELAEHHIYDTLRIAPEHVSKHVLKLMNKDNGDLQSFISEFKKQSKKSLSFYFMTAHPGSTQEDADKLAEYIRHLENTEDVQIFTPTPMSVSTCMYYTGMDPKTRKKIHVPYTYSEKKEQKRVLFETSSGKPKN